MPRSPTKVISVAPNLLLTFVSCAATVRGSWVLPGNTSMETGWPSSSQSKPMTICIFPFRYRPTGLDHGVGHFRPLSLTRQRHLLAYHGIAMSHEGLCQVF